jgi:hypothetical protein
MNRFFKINFFLSVMLLNIFSFKSFSNFGIYQIHNISKTNDSISTHNIAHFKFNSDEKLNTISFEIPKPIRYINKISKINRFYENTELFGYVKTEEQVFHSTILTDSIGDMLIEFSMFSIDNITGPCESISHKENLLSLNHIISTLKIDLPFFHDAALKTFYSFPFFNRIIPYLFYQFELNYSLFVSIVESKMPRKNKCYFSKIRRIINDKWIVEINIFKKEYSPDFINCVKRLGHSIKVNDFRPYRIIDSISDKNFTYALITENK